MGSEQRARIFGSITIIGAGLLTLGAVLVDVGVAAGQRGPQSVGYALIVASAIGLTGLPFGLRALGVGAGSALAAFGTVAFLLGTWIASLIDLPAVRDPDDLALGTALGPPAIILFSLGMLAWFAALRRANHLAGWLRPVVLLAGLWFFLHLPFQLVYFIVPSGRPSTILLAGVPGLLQLLIGVAIYREATRSQASDRVGGASTVWEEAD